MSLLWILVPAVGVFCVGAAIGAWYGWNRGYDDGWNDRSYGVSLARPDERIQ
ncbi:MAG: hypothetical protein L3K06_06195 [Thermoplasmata archaeon]|nr:hypothetical protein [Thermoplasmata archaeon]